MSNIMKSDPFLNAVDKYKLKEKSIEKNFLTGVLSLGKILLEERKVWKAKDRWTEYLEEIGKSMAGANQFIRLYEYSKSKANMKILEKANLTNWAKVNSFLAISEKLKIDIAKKLEGKSVLTSEEYANEIEELKTEALTEIIEEEEREFDEGNNLENSEDILEKIIKKQISSGISLNNIKTVVKQKLAKEVIKGVNDNSPKNCQLGNSSQIVLEKIIDLKIASVILKKEVTGLNESERLLWGGILKTDCGNLKKLVDKKFLRITSVRKSKKK